MDFEESLRKKLDEAFRPAFLHIENESQKHIGHAGHADHGNSHFHIKIRAAAFKGISRVEAQRRIYTLLATELRDTIHALSLDIAEE